jgi:hypothetical protein
MFAADWADHGHAGNHLWASDSADTWSFIEVFAAHGTNGNNTSRFGTAHQTYSIPYAEYFFANSPQVGVSATLTVRPGADGHPGIAESSQGLGGGVKSWTGHAATVVRLDAGLEVTNTCSRVDRAYVSSIQWRRQSDGLWVNVTAQHLVFETVPAGQATRPGIVSCGAVTKFRDWINSLIDVNPCS